MNEKILYKARVEIVRAMSPFDRGHRYRNYSLIYLRADKDLEEREIYRRIKENEDKLKRQIKERFKSRFGPLKVRDIIFKGEKEIYSGLIVEEFIFDI